MPTLEGELPLLIGHGGIPAVDVLRSRFRIYPEPPTDMEVRDLFPDGPLLLSLAEFARLTDSEGEPVPHDLHRFATLRQERTLDLPGNQDNFWGLMDWQNAHVLYFAVRKLAKVSEAPLRILVVGTGVGLVEEVLARIAEVGEIVTIDSYGSPTPMMVPLDSRQKSYQVKDGQRLGMFCESPKIRMILGDSVPVLIDLARDGEQFDVAVLDGDHRACYVGKETGILLREGLLKPSGLLAWDNYNQVPTNPGPTLAALAVSLEHGEILYHVSERSGFQSSMALWFRTDVSSRVVNAEQSGVPLPE